MRTKSDNTQYNKEAAGVLVERVRELRELGESEARIDGWLTGRHPDLSRDQRAKVIALASPVPDRASQADV